MISMQKVVAGIAAYLRAKLYPSLNLTQRMKVATALGVVQERPDGVIGLLLAVLLPDTPVEKTLEYGRRLGLLDEAGNVDADLLLKLGEEHVKEFGAIPVKLIGIEFDLGAEHLTALGEYIRAA